MPFNNDFSEIVSTLVPSCERVAIALNCPTCGRQLTPSDVEVYALRVRLVCSECHQCALCIDPE